MAKVTKTIGPLHFEDLEPHRFEDLVRQLAYGFRRWRLLEATGRLGQDDGMDIRGVELVGPPEVEAEAPGSEEGDEDDKQQLREERLWIFQCKRAQEIEPKDAEKIVVEAVPDPAVAPYGLVVAVACDLSKKTLGVLRAHSIDRKVQELHVWSRAHLEDLLFRPENDHLLFAYFGISLRLRRQNRLREVREAIATRRKVLRALGLESFEQSGFATVIVRDWQDSTYPDVSSAHDELNPPAQLPWEVASFEGFYRDGLLVTRFRAEGRVKADRTWDFYRPSLRREEPTGAAHFDHWSDEAKEKRERRAQAHEKETAAFADVPQPERQHIRFLHFLPFSAIVEVDPVGDPLHECPHFYCRYDDVKGGPYTGGALVQAPDHELKPEDRRTFFEPAAKQVEPDTIKKAPPAKRAKQAQAQARETRPPTAPPRKG